MCVCRGWGGEAHQWANGSGAARSSCWETSQQRRGKPIDAQVPECTGQTKESFTGERRTEEGDSGLGPLIYTKTNPIPLAATDGAPTCQATDNARLRAPPYIARRLSLSKREENVGREAARRGLPRPALGSTLTLILVASLFVT